MTTGHVSLLDGEESVPVEESAPADEPPLPPDAPAPLVESSCPEHFLARRGRHVKVRVMEIAGGHALIFGALEQNCLVRIHSRCLYGDALRSDDCDCGPELDLSLDMIQSEGVGVLIYLEQEGRGAGLIRKARAYELAQARRLNTFASYQELGYQHDYRTYAAAGAALNQLGLKTVRLLTNNPEKVRDLLAAGLRVWQVPLHILPKNRSVHEYLKAKREIRSHRLPQRWWVHRTLRSVSLGVGAVMISAVCTLGVGMASSAVAGSSMAMTMTGINTADRMVTVLAGLAATRWGWQRTSLWRARVRLLCSPVSESRIATDDERLSPRSPAARP